MVEIGLVMILGLQSHVPGSMLACLFGVEHLTYVQVHRMRDWREVVDDPSTPDIGSIQSDQIFPNREI